ncbi:MAG: hypothetical protein C4575_12925 [Desulforudis sp.]|jgi:hypothetical protein|nr:MAG: hypothetical protein C4575_12925 [Desulforudis sp.]
MAKSLISVTSKPPFRDILGRFTKADKGLLEDKREGMRNLGRRWVAIAREEAPLGKTGKFRKSIGYRTNQSGQTVGFSTFSAKPLGRWIIEGTPAHGIWTRRAFGVLRFFWEKGFNGPGIYFFRSVTHPGTKPNPFHERATDRWMPEADVELRRISRKYVMAVQGKG